jgi:hypothetical protein
VRVQRGGKCDYHSPILYSITEAEREREKEKMKRSKEVK